MKKPTQGWCVDGATSGNPGLSEYRCVDLATGEIIFHQKIGIATNNITEFCGLGHAILEAVKRNEPAVIYCDSTTAISWVRKKAVNSSMKPAPNNKTATDFSIRIVKALSSLNMVSYDNTHIDINSRVQVAKWYTGEWGEIPADFGRK